MGQVGVHDSSNSSSSSDSMSLQRLLNSRMIELRRQFLPTPASGQDRSAHLRRNLFGPIDHEENLRFVREEMDKLSQADCKRWNFDFQAEKPREGRYKWQVMDENVPQAYKIPGLTNRSPQANCSASTHSNTSKPQRNGKCIKRLHSKGPGKAMTQKLCTDYFKQVKVSKSVDKQNVRNEVPANTTSITSKLSEVLKIRSLNMR